jgi:hypothetical protein
MVAPLIVGLIGRGKICVFVTLVSNDLFLNCPPSMIPIQSLDYFIDISHLLTPSLLVNSNPSFKFTFSTPFNNATSKLQTHHIILM